MRAKILFVGNSFTARNNLPDLITQLAAARHKTIEPHLVSAGGASLRRHWNGEEALKAIENGHFDYIVLQEQTGIRVIPQWRDLTWRRVFSLALCLHRVLWAQASKSRA